MIEAVSSSAILAVACAYICAMSSYSGRTALMSFSKYKNACLAQAVMERAKATDYADLESAGGLTISDIDADMKKLSVDIQGSQIDAIRSRFN